MFQQFKKARKKQKYKQQKKQISKHNNLYTSINIMFSTTKEKTQITTTAMMLTINRNRFCPQWCYDAIMVLTPSHFMNTRTWQNTVPIQPRLP